MIKKKLKVGVRIRRSKPPQPSYYGFQNITLELNHIYVEYIHKNKMEKPHLE